MRIETFLRLFRWRLSPNFAKVSENFGPEIRGFRKIFTD
jgi:hypothetical protein